MLIHIHSGHNTSFDCYSGPRLFRDSRRLVAAAGAKQPGCLDYSWLRLKQPDFNSRVQISDGARSWSPKASGSLAPCSMLCGSQMLPGCPQGRLVTHRSISNSRGLAASPSAAAGIVVPGQQTRSDLVSRLGV
jgi:hypothetical protein